MQLPASPTLLPLLLLLSLHPQPNHASPVPVPAEPSSQTTRTFTYHLTPYSSKSCRRSTITTESSPVESFTVILDGNKHTQSHPLTHSPAFRSIHVSALAASCHLSLVTQSGQTVAVKAADSCVKLPGGTAGRDGEEGFVEVRAVCD